MEQNNNQIDNRQPCFRKVIGNTTYVVHVNFSENANITFKDRINQMLRNEMEKCKYNMRCET